MCSRHLYLLPILLVFSLVLVKSEQGTAAVNRQYACEHHKALQFWELDLEVESHLRKRSDRLKCPLLETHQS